jgi:hypothetical protein
METDDAVTATPLESGMVPPAETGNDLLQLLASGTLGSDPFAPFLTTFETVVRTYAAAQQTTLTHERLQDQSVDRSIDIIFRPLKAADERLQD